MHSGPPGFELDRSEAQLKKAGIPFHRHSRMVKFKGVARIQSYFLEITLNNVRHILHRPEEVATAIAQARDTS